MKTFTATLTGNSFNALQDAVMFCFWHSGLRIINPNKIQLTYIVENGGIESVMDSIDIATLENLGVECAISEV